MMVTVDLYVTGYGENHLYHNNGNGTFTDVTKKLGLTGGGWSTSAGWIDYDRDGGSTCSWRVISIGISTREQSCVEMSGPVYTLTAIRITSRPYQSPLSPESRRYVRRR